MASLKAMKYRELQRVAKEVGVKANLSTVVLIQKILDAKLAAHQRPHVRHGGIQAEREQPAEVGQHQVPHQEEHSSDEDSDTPEGKEADKKLLQFAEKIREKRKRALLDENGNEIPAKRRMRHGPIPRLTRVIAADGGPIEF